MLISLFGVPFLLSFVTPGGAFPKPLSSEEEKKQILLFETGTETEKQEAKKVLIEHNLRLVAHIAKKYNNFPQDQEDLISIGTIGLIKAISSYDSKKCIRLATYASRCIENEILMSLRASKKFSRDISLQEPIGTDGEGNEISMIDLLRGEEDNYAENLDLKAQKKQLQKILDTVLTPREQTVIKARYGLCDDKEVTQKEIGKRLHISRSYVSRIEKKALKKLFDSLNT